MDLAENNFMMKLSAIKHSEKASKIPITAWTEKRIYRHRRTDRDVAWTPAE